MLEFFLKLFDTKDFPPRWYCGNWSAGNGWLHIIADLGVWSAYVAIPCVLIWFVRKRTDLPFKSVFWLFGAFILACGTTHLMEAVIFWWPAYRFAGLIKICTAAISWATVISLVPVIPKALQLRSPESLQREIVERKKAEAELLVIRDDLEHRVQERVADLAAANRALELEVAERRRAQEQAEVANRMKDEFLGTLSHELRTPLTAIVGWTQLLRMGGKDEPRELEEGLDVIERNAHVQKRIIDDLLDVSRIISGNLRLDVRPVDLDQVIDDALSAILPATEAKRITIERTTDPDVGPVTGDPARLQQIVWNLVSNAVKFTPAGGRITILVRKAGASVQITVIDDGIGISPDFLPYVFDRFRQADSSTTRSYGGVGLGLSIVQKLVEQHGGTVAAESTGANRGSKFSVFLPAQGIKDSAPLPERPAAPDHDPDSAGDTDLSGLRVLVVDDEPDARDLIRRILVRRRAVVDMAASAEEALELVAIRQPHVILSDIGMPIRDGFDLIRQIRRRYPPREIAAAALTALARTEDRRKAIESGFQIHIAKPIDAGELVEAVANLAQWRRGNPA
jgi:signal transduction histidine kinase/ActR/RegA family two-component response regulator